MIELIRKILLGLLLAVYAVAAQSEELTIRITQGSEKAVPIAIVPFGWQGATPLPDDVSSIVDADLNRTGYFRTLAREQMLTKPTRPEEVVFKNWQVLGQEYLVIGQITPESGRYNIDFQLFNVYKNEPLMGYKMTVPSNELRRSAHRISDLIYEKLTGKKSDFGTRIAYITSVTEPNGRRKFKLQVADADGSNPKTVAASYEPLMSPAWSPDGKMLAYVSFERKSSAIYVQVLATGNRSRVAEFPGINGAPSWSPDGSKLALTLSKDGSPDIYTLNLSTRSLTKLTSEYSIDTEPVWSPDGSSIVFTSDRGGKPQLYMMPAHGGGAKRLTFQGDYNAGAAFSSDGRNLAMVHGNHGDYRVAVMDMGSKSINVLTAGRLDESPSFSPSGGMVLYASRQGGRGVLSAVSVDGRTHQKLTLEGGAVREPAWSPQ